MIIEITRSYIKMQVGDRTVTIEGEAHIPGHGSPDFVVYENSIRKWDPPNEKIEIDEISKKKILKLLKSEMKRKNMSFEVE